MSGLAANCRPSCMLPVWPICGKCGKHSQPLSGFTNSQKAVKAHRSTSPLVLLRVMTSWYPAPLATVYGYVSLSMPTVPVALQYWCSHCSSDFWPLQSCNILNRANKAQSTASAPWLVFILQDGLVDHYSPRSPSCSWIGIELCKLSRPGQHAKNTRQRGLNATIVPSLGVTSASAPSRHRI